MKARYTSPKQAQAKREIKKLRREILLLARFIKAGIYRLSDLEDELRLLCGGPRNE